MKRLAFLLILLFTTSLVFAGPGDKNESPISKTKPLNNGGHWETHLGHTQIERTGVTTIRITCPRTETMCCHLHFNDAGVVDKGTVYVYYNSWGNEDGGNTQPIDEFDFTCESGTVNGEEIILYGVTTY